MTNEVKKRSITANDTGTVGGASVIRWMLYSATPQATGLPAYWSPSRDYYLRLLQYEEFHDFWGGAISIATTKMSSLAWELESDQPRVRNYFQDMLLAADDNQSWVKFISRHLQDFLCTDNGCFVEVVRATSAAGSRILGLMHLDSLRCTRTGDPEIPVLYRDTKGVTHEVQAHQVLMFADMASPSETYFGVGLSAASRCYGAIRKLEAIERYIYEKISGSRALALDLVGGVLEKDIETGVQAAREMNEARGNTSYLGSVMVAVPSDVPVTHTRIDFASLPDGFVYDTQVNNAILTIANAIGLDVQDLQPLTGRPLGSGEQSQTLNDKAEGKGLAAWRQQWTHLTNQYILPDSVVFAFSEKDLNNQQRQADVNKTVTDTVATMVEKIGVTADQGKQILADAEVIPQEFVPDDTTPREAISDTEKPQVEAAAQEGAQEEADTEQPDVEQATKAAGAIYITTARGTMKCDDPYAETPQWIPVNEQAMKEAIGQIAKESTYKTVNGLVSKEAQPADGSDPFAEKSIASVSRKFHAALRSLATLGFVSSGSILADVRRTIKDAIGDAYIEGLAEGGIPADEMGDDDALMIIELTEQQTPYITDFVRAIRDAQGDKAAQRDILDNRIALWTQSVEAAGAAGLASAKRNEMVTWRLGKTEQHCDTCARLDGQRHRRSWFADRNYYPRKPGASLECGGFQCDCTLEP